MLSLLEAIGKEEGILVPGSRANRNNNPGNIEFGKFALANGAKGSDGRFAIFSTLQDGYACLHTLLSVHYYDLTIAQAIHKYAPSFENDTDAYVRNVCEWSGFLSTAIIRDVL